MDKQFLYNAFLRRFFVLFWGWVQITTTTVIPFAPVWQPLVAATCQPQRPLLSLPALRGVRAPMTCEGFLFMIVRTFTAIFAVATLTLAAPAISHASLVWAGVSGGHSTSAGVPGATNVGVLAGVDIPLIPFLNAEVGYQRLDSWNTHLLTGSALFRFPILPDIHALARVGVAHRTLVSPGISATNNDLFYGIGASVRVADPISVRAEYEVARDSGADIHSVLGSLVLHF